jgi:hypothetical protein
MSNVTSGTVAPLGYFDMADFRFEADNIALWTTVAPRSYLFASASVLIQSAET